MEKRLAERYTVGKWKTRTATQISWLLFPENIPFPCGYLLNSMSGEKISSFTLTIRSSRIENQWEPSSPQSLTQDPWRGFKENEINRSKPCLVAIDTNPACESKKRRQMDTIPVTEVVPLSQRRHRFLGDSQPTEARGNWALCREQDHRVFWRALGVFKRKQKWGR